jgi:hypothetical protein
MSRKQCYLYAARLIDQRDFFYSCSAVNTVAKYSRGERCVSAPFERGLCPSTLLYQAIFNDCKNDQYGTVWAGQIARSTLDPIKLRVLMLCLMAECYKDFEDKE